MQEFLTALSLGGKSHVTISGMSLKYIFMTSFMLLCITHLHSQINTLPSFICSEKMAPSVSVLFNNKRCNSEISDTGNYFDKLCILPDYSCYI